MQRKPGFPVANCSIKMPDSFSATVNPETMCEDEGEQHQRRQQLINFGHSQWGFNNWNWSVTKQELDFVDYSNGKYCAGVVAFVSVTLKVPELHRENIGYATSVAANKGFAIYKSRKCAATNALRETLLSFGGSVASDLADQLQRDSISDATENNPNVANRLAPPAGQHPSPQKAPPSPQKAPPAPQHAAPPHQPTVAPPQPAAPLLQPAAQPFQPAAPLPAVKNAPVGKTPPLPGGRPARAPRPTERTSGPEVTSEEEARAERKRRQRQAQEDFRLKRLAKNSGHDEKQDLSKNCSSIDRLLLDIPTQDIVIEETGQSGDGKRKSPAQAQEGNAKRRSVLKLDIIQTE